MLSSVIATPWSAPSDMGDGSPLLLSFPVPEDLTLEVSLREEVVVETAFSAPPKRLHEYPSRGRMLDVLDNSWSVRRRRADLGPGVVGLRRLS
jgi:hypothetical protein